MKFTGCYFHLHNCPIVLIFTFLVWSLFFFECLTTLFATISAWLLLGSGWGDIEALLILPWSFDPLPALSGFLASIVHFFFCWRIYKLTSVIWLPVFIGAVSHLSQDCKDSRTKPYSDILSPMRNDFLYWHQGSQHSALPRVAFLTVNVKVGMADRQVAELVKLPDEVIVCTSQYDLLIIAHAYLSSA